MLHDTRNHTIRIITISFLIIFIGIIMLNFYWNSRPILKMRFQHQVDLILKPKINARLSTEVKNVAVAQEVPILLYHGIFEEGDDGFSISKAQFEEHLIALKRAGFKTITTEEYATFLEGKISLPDKTIMITFDDGRKDSYYRADAVLKATGYKAVMYLTSGYSIVDTSNYYVDSNEMNQMHFSGRWDIEAHSDNAGTNKIVIDRLGEKGTFFGNLKWLVEEERHENIDEYRSRVADELIKADNSLERHLGSNTVSTFAFPFGDYAQKNPDKRISDVLLTEAQKVYKQTFVQFRKGEPYSSNYRYGNDFVSRRIEVNPNLSGKELVDTLARSTAKPLPFIAEMNDMDGWKDDWGSISINKGELLIKADKNGTGATTYLDGTRQLQAYKVSTKFSDLSDNDTTIKLVALYRDGDNYVGCNFMPDRVRVENISDGIRVVLNETVQPEDYRKEGRLGITVDKAGGIDCTVQNQNVVSSDRTIGILLGGPAIVIWHPNTGIAKVTVSEFSIAQ